MAHTSWLTNNWFKIGVLLVLATIGLSVGYHFVVTIPGRDSWKRSQEREKSWKEQQKLDQLESEKRQQEFSLSVCLDSSEEEYWEYMKINGTENEDGTVWALDKYWQKADKDRNDRNDNCYKRYPLN